MCRAAGWLDGGDISQCIFHDFLPAGLENRLAGRERVVYAIRKEYWERETNIGRRERYLQAMGSRTTRNSIHSLRLDLSSARWPFAPSPVGPSQFQLWDIKTMGVGPKYVGDSSVQPVEKALRSLRGGSEVWAKPKIECYQQR